MEFVLNRPAHERLSTPIPEYLKGDQRSDIRHEQVAGQAFVMASLDDIYENVRQSLRHSQASRAGLKHALGSLQTE